MHSTEAISLSVFTTILFILAVGALTCLSSALRRMHKKGFQKQTAHNNFLKIFLSIQKWTHADATYENFLLNTLCAQHLCRGIFYFSGFAFLFASAPLASFIDGIYHLHPGQILRFIFSLFFLMMTSLVASEILPRNWGTKTPEKALKAVLWFALPFLVIALPIFALLSRRLRHLDTHFVTNPFSHEPPQLTKDSLIELLQESSEEVRLDEHQKKLIHAVLNFRDRVVREVMVPRVELFCLSADMSIREAASLLKKEGYSRTPVYRGSIDNIVGVLMYKDILSRYMEYPIQADSPFLDSPIESVMKHVLYTPETKRISQLLQEFRKKQVHLAIVVDEYGGTEGIVTIEDILEEIVGEISDEYDDDPVLFKNAGKGCWIADARMNLLDVEEELGIKIPQEGDYDTIGGYIYQRLGTIPTQGSIIHHDEFTLEILDSNERGIQTVKVSKLRKTTDDGEKNTVTHKENLH